ncbi:MAG: cyclic nucleotide-binding domain-containing protein [Thermoanaerobaculia bacterium]
MAYSVTDFEPQDFIFKQGDDGEFMYLVKEGEVEVLQELGGGEQQVAVLERGDFFGEMAVLDQEPRSHSVRALTRTKLVEIDRSGFQHMLKRNAEITVRMIRKLSQRLAHTEDMLLRAFAGQAVFEGKKPAAEAAVTGNARLVLLSDLREIPMPDKAEVAVGRVDPVNGIHPDIDLTTIDVQLTTSRRHARLIRSGDGFFIQEEQATNGTFVNGQRISSERPLEIRSGDEIMFGVVAMRFLWN